MVHVLRKYQQPLMIVITIVIIIAFGVFFTPGNRSARDIPSRGYRIYGHNYTQEDLDKRSRGFGVAMYVGLNDLLKGLCGNAASDQEAVSNFVFNGFILDHEVERLGITVEDGEIVQAIEKLPRFQTDGAFDPKKYQTFRETVLGPTSPNGFNVDRFERLVRDQLYVQKLQTLLGSTAEVPPSEFRNQYVQRNQKIHLSVIRLALADFKAAIQPTEEEITKIFADREKTYIAPEKRVVSYVKFDLSAAEKALKGKDLMEARQNLVKAVEDFGQDILKENASLAQVAKDEKYKNYGIEVKTTPEFSMEALPADLTALGQAGTAAAFKLTEKESTSDALSVDTAYYILHLEKVTPSRQLTLEEARPQVVEQIKTERANEALTSTGNQVRTKIAEAVKAGKTFADAAKDAGQKLEVLPVFSIVELPKDLPNSMEIITKAVELPVGELSDFVPVAEGGLIVHVDSREPIDEAQLKKDEATQFARVREMNSEAVFNEWLRTRSKLANLQTVGQQPRTAE